MSNLQTQRFKLFAVLGFNEAIGGVCAQGHERAESRELFWPGNRHRC